MKKLFYFLLLNTLLFSSNIVNKQLFITTIDSTSHELVYDPNSGKKLSELIWKAKDIQMFGFRFDYAPSRKAYLNFSYKTNISEDATMDDYDWLKDDTSKWSDWSNHPNTNLEKFTILDISYNKYFKTKYDLKTDITIGYRIEEKAFKAYDGSYVYSSSSGFRDLSGSFSGLGISYEEEFKTIYLGLKAEKQVMNLILSGKMLYSPKTKSENKDNHHNRYFINRNKFSDTTMKSVEATIEYPINNSLSIALEYLDVKYDKVKGTTTRTYYTGATEAPAGSIYRYGGAGISNSYSSLNLSLIAKF